MDIPGYVVDYDPYMELVGLSQGVTLQTYWLNMSYNSNMFNLNIAFQGDVFINLCSKLYDDGT